MLLEDDYEEIESLDHIEKSSFVLGSEQWGSTFDGFLSLINFIL